MGKETVSTTAKPAPEKGDAGRKPYQAPVLSRYGDLRDVSKGRLAYAAEEGRIYSEFAAS